MRKSTKLLCALICCWAVSAVVSLSMTTFEQRAQAADPPAQQNDAALSRARKQVRMLDDIYKGGVVLITENYVNEPSDLPAGKAFKMLFATAKQKGWHEVRLLDATGEPYNDENAPNDEFEKKAIQQLKKGEAYYEQVVANKDGSRSLRAATPIPVVMKKCVMCHDNYADLPKDQAIGALSYTIPIE